MFSKEESKKIRKEFWVSYGKSFPRKWTLYNTKIKDLSFKFIAESKKAGVTLDIESLNNTQRELLFQQIESLKNILKSEYLPDIIFEKDYTLDNNKIISRIYVPYQNKFNIHNKDTWLNCYQFFNTTMSSFELFWEEYKDYIAQAVV